MTEKGAVVFRHGTKSKLNGSQLILKQLLWVDKRSKVILNLWLFLDWLIGWDYRER
jgi:hypothetical protein